MEETEAQIEVGTLKVLVCQWRRWRREREFEPAAPAFSKLLMGLDFRVQVSWQQRVRESRVVPKSPRQSPGIDQGRGDIRETPKLNSPAQVASERAQGGSALLLLKQARRGQHRAMARKVSPFDLSFNPERTQLRARLHPVVDGQRAQHAAVSSLFAKIPQLRV